MFKKLKSISILLSLVMLFSLVIPFQVSLAADDITTITILHTNDTHSRVDEGKYDGMGMAKLYSLVKQYREKNSNTLLLDAGDTFHGNTFATLVKGESIAQLMNVMGYDAMTAGNHDFNYGYQRLVELDGITNFPILSANVKQADQSNLLTPYIIKEIDGVKVGIFGLSTPETTFKTHPKNVEGLTFADPVEEAKVMVNELKDKADVIIALSHLGMDKSSKVTSVKVASEVPGIDVIIDGHSHTTLEEGQLVGNTLISSTGEYDKNLGVVELTIKNGKVTDKKASLVNKEATADVVADEELTAKIAEIKAEQDKVLSEVIGTTAVKLDGERELVRAGETNLGNLITDAMIETSGADLAITNGGGIRASIEAGEITKGEVITVLPFGNYIVTKTIKGSDIKAALEHGTDAYPELKGAFPHVSGLTFTIDTSKEVGNRVVSILVNGQALDMEKEYVVATNDFMAAGGDDYTMFADYPITNEFPALDEAVINYIQKEQVVAPKVEARFNVQKVTVQPQENKKVEKVEQPQTKKPVLVKYKVKRGDTLWGIAKQLKTTWQKLQQINQLKNPDLIFPKQIILVPNQK